MENKKKNIDFLYFSKFQKFIMIWKYLVLYILLYREIKIMEYIRIIIFLNIIIYKILLYITNSVYKKKQQDLIVYCIKYLVKYTTFFFLDNIYKFIMYI